VRLVIAVGTWVCFSDHIHLIDCIERYSQQTFLKEVNERGELHGGMESARIKEITEI
jgi:hypothetical protein